MRKILYECDGCLAVPHHKKSVSLQRKWMPKYFDAPDHEHSDIVADQKDDPKLANVSLISAVINEDLRQLHRR